MKLHLDKKVFKQFINKIGIESNIDLDILEKDYYVCCILQELSAKQDELQAYFKGGTAIYKILDTMNRFSEDIDLTVKKSEGISNTQKKKRFEASAFGYSIEGLNLNREESKKDGRSEIAVYEYDSVFDVDIKPLQRAGKIQIESTSFTVSEPIEEAVIEPMIYKIANNKEKEILKENYEVCSINLKIIKLERMFIDKIFAAEFYFTKEKYTDMAKHIYDISVLMENKKVKLLLENRKFLEELISYKREEEKERTRRC